MRLAEAQHELKMRCYYWWVSEFEKEINNSFPNLRLFKSGYGWKLYHFMQELEPRDRITLAHAKCKHGSAYLKDSGEMMTEEEEELLQSFRQFALEPSGLELELQSKKQVGERIRFASKRKLREAAVARFIEAFGSQCADMKIEKEWDPLFRMKFCGWIVSTQLMIGRQQGLVHYRHIIESETRIQHPQNSQITGPEMTLSPGLAWLVNRWEDVLDGDVEGACCALIKHISFFFEAAPKLLKGLEFQRIAGSNE